MFIDILIQAIGFIGIALNIWALQYNKHWQIVLLKTLGSLAFVIQYILLGAYTGAAMDIIGITRNIILIFTVKKQKNTLPSTIIFSAITLALGIYTWEGIISLLAIVAKLLSTIGYGIKEAHKIRLINLPSSALWLVYNGIHFSLAGVVNEVLVIASIIIAEIRFRKKPENINENLEK